MSRGRAGALAEPEQAARAHAERIVRRDRRALDDLAAGAEVTPPDILDWLMTHQFRGSELVAHARIGVHHVLKTKFVGASTIVVQARWAAEADGRWLIREMEVARVEGVAPGAPGPVARPGEV